MKTNLRFCAILVIPALLVFGAGRRSFDSAVPLETLSETTANASLGDLNGDGGGLPMAYTIRDDDGVSNLSGNPHLTQLVETAIARNPARRAFLKTGLKCSLPLGRGPG